MKCKTNAIFFFFCKQGEEGIEKESNQPRVNENSTRLDMQPTQTRLTSQSTQKPYKQELTSTKDRSFLFM
jgi:hypothetical protein